MCLPLKKLLTLTFKENNNLGRESFKTHQDETLESAMGKHIFTGSKSGQPACHDWGTHLCSRREIIYTTQQTVDNPEGLNVISKTMVLDLQVKQQEQGTRVERMAKARNIPTYFLTLFSVLPST